MLRPRRTQKLLHPHRVSSLAQHFATSTKISEVLGTQLLPDPRPEFLHWVQVRRLRWHVPKPDLLRLVRGFAEVCSQKAFVVSKYPPGAPFTNRVQCFDCCYECGPGFLVAATCLHLPRLAYDLPPLDPAQNNERCDRKSQALLRSPIAGSSAITIAGSTVVTNRRIYCDHNRRLYCDHSQIAGSTAITNRRLFCDHQSQALLRSPIAGSSAITNRRLYCDHESQAPMRSQSQALLRSQVI